MMVAVDEAGAPDCRSTSGRNPASAR